MNKPRGIPSKDSQLFKHSREKVEISYREFAEKCIEGVVGGKIEKAGDELKEQIDMLMKIKHFKIKDLMLVSALPFDLCRKFKGVAEVYVPVEIKLEGVNPIGTFSDGDVADDE